LPIPISAALVSPSATFDQFAFCVDRRPYEAEWALLFPQDPFGMQIDR
jgi:hypothetical protein